MCTVCKSILYDGVRDGLLPRREGETQDAIDRADDVGQSERTVRQQRLRHSSAAAVSASVHVHQVSGGRLARQTALRAATSRSRRTPTQRESQ